MIQTALRLTPRLRDVVLEQIRAVGLALRLPASAAAVLFGLATLLLVTQIFRQGEVIDFHPERWLLPGVVGLLLPIGVWYGEQRFGDGFLWTLPVERRRHALARVLAGWVWLMGSVVLFMLWLLGLALLSGGSVLSEETLRLVPSSFDPAQGPLAPAAVSTVRWTPEPLFWLAPFTGASVMYLLASALAIGLRHPWRWITGIVFGYFLFVSVADVAGRAADVEWLIAVPSHLFNTVISASYGLEALLVARTEFLETFATLSTGQRVVVWRGVPDARHWTVVTLLYTGAGLAVLWVAASRHRERRRR